ncbi:MAG: hypothetical protein Q4B58_07030 [Bacteroidales bacterium]|nr:hypothetical protein [Bacteroidales bacterium]
MMKKFILILSVILTLFVSAKAAIGEVTATIDTPYVMVGMPRVLHLELTVPKDAKVEWPRLHRQGGVAAVDMEQPDKSYLLEFGPDTNFEIDTLSSTEGQITLAQNLQVLAFDSAAMVIRAIPFVIDGKDTLYSDVVALNCDHPFESIADDPQGMMGLKEILDPPFVLWDYLRWVVYVLIALALAALVGWLAYYLYKRYKKGDALVEEKKPEVLLPAHEVAMHALLDLEQKHLWEGGRFKEYHTELTDILRRYIERRYQVQAMESTSDEIMQELVELQIQQKSSFNNLRDVLKMADYVKFAKYEPSAEENQISFYNSRLFVEQTKEIIVEKKEGESSSEENNN